MKTCFKCGQSKPLDQFYRHPQMGDGHLNKCKDCAKRDVQENYRMRRDEKRAYDRSRAKTPERKRFAAEARKLHRARYPEKTKARNAVAKALRGGRLEKKPCEICGDPKSQAHHEDYSKPLEVQWLCVMHHYAVHGRLAI